MKAKLMFLLSIMLVLAACKTPEKKSLPVVTKQIQYIVELKNPDTVADLRHEFLDDSSHMALVSKITTAVLDGSVKAWETDGAKFVAGPTEILKKRLTWDKSVTVPDSLDPINFPIDPMRITKIRYFEEWVLDDKNMCIEKHVKAYCLMYDIFDENGMYRGYEPLFYIFFDDAFKTELEKQFQQ